MSVRLFKLCIEELPMRVFYEQVLPQNPYNLLRIARFYFNRPELTLPKKFLLIHTARVITADESLTDFERSLLLAESAYLGREWQVAADGYANALSHKPKDTPWRYAYAVSLYELGKFDEAMAQLKICQLDSSMKQNKVRSLTAKIRRER